MSGGEREAVVIEIPCGLRLRREITATLSRASAHSRPHTHTHTITRGLVKMQSVTLPQRVLKEKSLIWGLALDSVEFAARLDQEDPLSSFRSLFAIPRRANLPFGTFSLLFSFPLLLLSSHLLPSPVLLLRFFSCHCS